MSELRKSFIHSVAWTTGSNVGGFLINFFLGVWLARILGPEAYGLVGMVMVVTGFGRLFMDFGFGEALIQNQDTKEEDFSSVFWFNIIVSIFLFILFFFLSGFIASFYVQPVLKSISQVISSVFFLNALGMVQRIKLEKELKFKQIGIAELLSSLLSILIAISLAIKGFGVWSLVYLNLLKPLFYSVFIWLFSKWMPNITFNIESLLKLAKFSTALLINGFLEMIASTIDKVLIGKLQGDNSLGIYSKSFATVRMPVMQVMSAIGRVIFPTFSSIQSDDTRIFEIYKKFILIISSLIFPIMVVFYFFKDEIILLLFGNKWSEMIPIFGIFALTTGFLPFNILADSVVKSKGKVNHLNYITFFEKPLAIIAVIIGVIIGSLEAIALSISIGIFIIFLIKSYIVCLSLSQSFLSLMIEHLKALLLLIIPIIGLVGMSFFKIDYGLTFKILYTFILFSISVFMFRYTLLFPLNDFIQTLLKNRSSKN
jgi:O-antigen/teichoic acid export membrane protein